MKNLIFLCVASAVFILSVIVLNYAPTITGLVGKGMFASNGFASDEGWAGYPCRKFSDQYNEYKDEPWDKYWESSDLKDEYLDLLKEGKNYCLRKKAMIGLEYSAFNLDVIFSFVCAILGVLLYSGNKVGKIAGLIGLGGGAIGFVLTLVYVIYSGIVFNSDVIGKHDTPFPLPSSGSSYLDPCESSLGSSSSGCELATDSDGAYMEWNGNKYVCIFYDKDNKDKLYQKYSNYGNKYLNYYHFNSKDKDEEYYKYKSEDIYGYGESGCYSPGTVNWKNCKDYDESTTSITQTKIYDKERKEIGKCDKLYLIKGKSTDERKNLYNSWVTTIVFGCFIFVLDAVLAVFGFLVYKDSSGTSGAI